MAGAETSSPTWPVEGQTEKEPRTVTWIVRIPLASSFVDERAVGEWEAISPPTSFTCFPAGEALPVTTVARA
jgi:hypothetical protein